MRGYLLAGKEGFLDPYKSGYNGLSERISDVLGRGQVFLQENLTPFFYFQVMSGTFLGGIRL